MFDLNILGRKSGIDEHGGGFLYRNCESITVCNKARHTCTMILLGHPQKLPILVQYTLYNDFAKPVIEKSDHV